MIILSLDSTARSASAAIITDGNIAVSMMTNNGRTHSEQLLPMTENCLSRAGMTVRDIDAFAVTVGPGSFTGVRIGVSVVKGLAFGTDKPCVALSTLHTIAAGLAPLPGLLCAVMDARRAEVYTAVFKADTDGSLCRLTDDAALSLDALAETLAGFGGTDTPVWLAGDGIDAAREVLASAGINVCLPPISARLQTAASAGLLAASALAGVMTDKTCHILNDRIIAPVYLRIPQAERERADRTDH